MKVLFVCHEAIPSSETTTEQVVKAASAMAALGVEVVVTTTARMTGDARAWADRVAQHYGVPATEGRTALTLASLPAPWASPQILRRPWHDLRAARLGKRGGFDVIYVRDPIPLTAALLTDTPVVFETYRYDLNTRASYRPWRSFCYGRPGLLGVVTHSQMTRQSFVRVGFPDDALLVAYNGYDPPRDGVSTRAEARRFLQLDEHAQIVAYAGDVTPSKGIESVLPVAEALPGVQFLILGHDPGSPATRWFHALVADRSLVNVRSIPRVPPAEVSTYLSAADCLFLPTASSPLLEAKRTVLPMKTFRYLGAGRPIVGPDLPDVQEVLRDGDNALLVPPDRPTLTVEAVRRVLEDRSLAERMGAAARATAAQLSWSSRALRIKEFMVRRLAVRGHRSAIS